MGKAACTSLWLASSIKWSHGLDEQCRDPLFGAHWYGKNDIPTLDNFPTVETGLKLCPAYNRLASCCNTGFEQQQQKHFDFWRNTIFAAKLARVAMHRQAVSDVQNTAEYAVASHTEVEQIKSAMERFAPVLNPVIHADCLSAAITYVAGMICFGCKPDWFEYINRRNNEVVRVRVASSVCVEVWSRCEPFGEAARALEQALLDSVLAKQAKKPAESLSMFFDQQSLCSWLHDRVALHPFTRPTEADKEAAPEVIVVQGKDEEDYNLTDIDGYRARRTQVMIRKELDVLGEGKRSGFDLSWINMPSSLAPWSRRLPLVVSILFIIQCAS